MRRIEGIEGIEEKLEALRFELESLRQEYRAHLRTGNVSGSVFLVAIGLALAWLFIRL